jgi:O-acetyl-ADP-ribose deacetylase (regulator of RNase III)
MKEIKGDLIELAKAGQFDVIAHGCNCHNTMGAGIAKQIKKEFNGAYVIDQYTKKGDYNKLGNFTKVYQNNVWIYNCYTQYNFGTEKVQLDYESLILCLRKINKENYRKTIGLPKIGCGLAGGDWNIVKKIIENELKDMDVTIVDLVTTKF